MKILKEQTWWVFDCKDCKSTLQAEPEDVRYDFPDADPISDGNKRFYVACPKCGARCTVLKLTKKIVGEAKMG